MNKLLFSEGGQPLNLDDLEFMQTSTIDAIKALASPWGNCVLAKEWRTGAHTGGSILRWDSCMVCVNGKIAYLPESELNMSDIYTSEDKTVYIQVSSQEDNIKSFADGSQHPTRKLYRAEMKVGVLPDSLDVLPLFGARALERSDYIIGEKIKKGFQVKEVAVPVSSVRDGVSIRLKIKDIQGIRILFGEIELSHGAIENFDGYICTLAQEGAWRPREYWRALMYGYRMGFKDVAFVICKDSGEVFNISSPDEIRIVNASGEAPSRLEIGTYSFRCILP